MKPSAASRDSIRNGIPSRKATLSGPVVAKLTNAGWTEGNLKWRALPRNRYSLVRAAGMINEETGLVDAECTLMPLYVFMTDHKAETINEVIAAVKEFRDTHTMEGVNIRLASGNVGVQAATNEQLERSELPMMIYVYLAIIVLVLVGALVGVTMLAVRLVIGRPLALLYGSIERMHFRRGYSSRTGSRYAA